MLDKVNFLAVVILNLILISTSFSGTISVRQGLYTDYKGDEVTALVFENDLYVLKVVPSMGARIMSWVDKDSNRPDGEYVYNGLGDAGFFDDRAALTTANYEWEIIKEKDGSAVVKCWVVEESGILREKIIRGFSGNRLVTVTYILTNKSKSNLAESLIMWRHIPRSYYGNNTPDMNNAIVSSTQNGMFIGLWPAVKQGMEANQYVFENPPDNWMGGIHLAGKDGVVFWLPDQQLSEAYFWSSPRIPYETIEPVVTRPTLAPGESWTCKINTMIQRGLDGYVDVTEKCLVNLKPVVEGKKVTFSVSIVPVSEMLDLVEKPVVKTWISDLQGNKVAELDDLQFPRIWIKGNLTSNTIETKSINWTATLDGTYICKQEIWISSKKHSEYEVPFVVGIPSGEYVYGGVKKVKNILYELDKADVDRGYIVVRRLNSGPVQNVEKITVDMGRNETEAIPLELISYTNLGRVKVSISDLVGCEIIPSDQIRLRYRVLGKDNPYDIDGYKLFDGNEFDVEKGKPVEIWISFKIPKMLTAGDYHAVVTISPHNAAALKTPLDVKVWPVMIADKRLSRFFSFWELYIFWQYASNRDPADLAVLWEKYARDLSEAGERTVHFDLRYDVWSEKLPDGTMSYAKMDPIMDIAVKYGFDSIWTGGAVCSEDFANYVRSKGLKIIYAHVWDESPIEISPEQMEIINKDKKDSRPYVRREGCISPVSIGLIKNLHGYLTDWSFGGGVAYQVKIWIEDKKIPWTSEDKLGFYCGGTHVYSYPYMATYCSGWLAGYLDCAHWTQYSYMRMRPTLPWRTVFPSANGPISSPTWEAIKEGNECFEYMKMLHKAIRDLETAGKTEKAMELKSKLEHIISASDDSLIQVKELVSDSLLTAQLVGELTNYYAAKRELLKLLVDVQK